MGSSQKKIHLAKKLEVQKELQKLGSRTLRFSFEYLQMDHAKFPISDCTSDFLCHLLHTMADYSKMTTDQFRVNDEQHHRHPLTFEETTEPNGFGLDPNQVGSEEPYQFGLCDGNLGSTGAWRVHGFLRGDTFCIRWLDPNHQLTSKSGRGPKTKNKDSRMRPRTI
jgi:hypothetical protein